MTKQTLATALLLLSAAVLLVVPAVHPADGEINNIHNEETTVSAETTTTPAVTETTPAVTTAAVTEEAHPSVPDRIVFDEKITSAEDALDLIQRHFFTDYTVKVPHAGGGYHYSPENKENYILTIADGNIPYQISMAVTINDEPLTSAVYYVTPDGDSTIVGTKNDSAEGSEVTGTPAPAPDSFSVTLDTEISSPDEALELVQKHFAFEYTQKHSYETIGTYYTKPNNPNARLEYERGWNETHIIHQYTDDGREDFRYKVTSKDGKTTIEPYFGEDL